MSREGARKFWMFAQLSNANRLASGNLGFWFNGMFTQLSNAESSGIRKFRFLV